MSVALDPARAVARRRYYETRERVDPAWVAANRARNRLWYREAGLVKQDRPWLYGAPPFGPYLPGAGCEMEIIPAPKWPVELRNVRALHGVLHHLIGEGHSRQPAFAIVPWHNRLGWGVWWWDERRDGAPAGPRWQRFACKRFEVNLFNRDCVIRFGGAHRVKSPTGIRRGRRRVRIDAITPVHIRSVEGRSDSVPVAYVHRLVPTNQALLSTLRVNLAERLGVALGADDVQLRVLSHDVATERVDMGGKYGRVPGWVGHCIVEANAPARWLLACAERVGLGGRTAFGWGRVRATDVDG